MNDQLTLAFLIPFASQKVKSKWNLACAHLRQTLRSVQNSRNGNYCVVVAGHEPPDFDVQFDSRFHFLSLNHATPNRESYPVSLKLDKLAKIAAAWDYVKSTYSPKYIMKLDADDLISSELVGWLAKAGGEAGYLIKYGWLWRPGSRCLIEHTEYLDRTCGSCLIIRSDVADDRGPFLTEVEGVRLDHASSSLAASHQYSLVPGSGVTTLLLNDTHQRYASQFAYLGHELHTLPFNAVIYRISPDSVAGASDDRTRKFNLRMTLGAVRRKRFITPKLRKEFMLR